MPPFHSKLAHQCLQANALINPLWVREINAMRIIMVLAPSASKDLIGSTILRKKQAQLYGLRFLMQKSVIWKGLVG